LFCSVVLATKRKGISNNIIQEGEKTPIVQQEEQRVEEATWEDDWEIYNQFPKFLDPYLGNKAPIQEGSIMMHNEEKNTGVR